MRSRLAAAGLLLAWSCPAQAEEPPLRVGESREVGPTRPAIVTLGLQARSIYGTPTWLATMSLGLAFSKADLALQVARGETSSSLRVTEVSTSLYLYRSPWRGVRLGPSTAVGLISVERVTNDSPLILFFARFGARGEVDLATTRFAPLLSLDVGAAGPHRALSVVLAMGGRF